MMKRAVMKWTYMRAQGPNAQCIVYYDLSYEYTQTIWCILCIKFSMDLESPGFELGTFRFQTRRSTTELTRRYSILFYSILFYSIQY